MSGMITDLTALASGSVDRTADLLEIVDLSANTSYKITVNNLVGISGGSVVSTSDTQVLTNKTIGNTNTVTVKDSLFTLQDDGDTSKQVVFQLSSITTATTRTLTVPDATGTLVLTGATQTLTGKTLTSPVINTPTIVNPTITVDSISEYTSANGVTIDGLNIKDGVIGTNGVANASIADSAVTPAKLLSGTGTGWAWQSWTPTWTNLTVGNATQAAVYIQMGKTVFARINLALGSTTAVGTEPSFTLPVTASLTAYNGGNSISPLGQAGLATSANVFDGVVLWLSTTTARVRYNNAASTAVINTAITATAPGAWTTGDVISLTFMYEAA